MKITKVMFVGLISLLFSINSIHLQIQILKMILKSMY